MWRHALFSPRVVVMEYLRHLCQLKVAATGHSLSFCPLLGRRWRARLPRSSDRRLKYIVLHRGAGHSHLASWSPPAALFQPVAPLCERHHCRAREEPIERGSELSQLSISEGPGSKAGSSDRYCRLENQLVTRRRRSSHRHVV